MRDNELQAQQIIFLSNLKTESTSQIWSSHMSILLDLLSVNYKHWTHSPFMSKSFAKTTGKHLKNCLNLG
jgi:hypothetical protein